MSDVPVATGAITLDRDKAKEKLRRFQLADPCAWLLELVRAAVAQGATAVSVRTDADDIRVSFNGDAYTLADVEELYEALLARRAPPARQHLAVALNGAMALEPRFVEVKSKGARGGVRLRLVPGMPDQFGVLEEDDAPNGTTVWLRHPFRAGAFVEFFKARLGTQREITALRHGCRFSDVPVTINQRALVWVPPNEASRAVRSRGGQRGLVFRARAGSDERHGLLVFTFRGVVLEELPYSLLPAGLCALLPADHLTRDASLGAFVRDQPWAELVDAALVEALALCESERGELLQRAARALGPALLFDGKEGDPLASAPRLRAALSQKSRPILRQAVLQAVDGSDVTLAELRSALRSGHAVATAARGSFVPRKGAPIVLVCNDRDLGDLVHFVGARHTSGEQLLVEAERRHHGLERLRERAAPVALHPGEVLGSKRWSTQSARGIVGLTPGGSRLRLVLFQNGHLIGTHVLECPLPGITMAIEAPFALQPDCTDVVRDGVFTRALRAAFAALPDALADACSNARPRVGLAGRALPLLAWALDAEALWHKLAAHAGCPLLPDLAPLPALVLEGVDRHAVCSVACLPCVDGTMVSLDAVRGQTVVVVPPDTEQFSLPSAIKGGEVLRAVLALVARIEPRDEQAKREGQRARMLRAAPTVRAPYPPAVPFRIGDVAKGWVCFGGARPGISLEAHIEGRALPAVHFGDAQLGSLRIIVDDPHLLPLVDGKLAAADARRLARAGLGAAGGLLATIAGGPGASVPGRRLSLAILTMVAPSSALARAAEVLTAAEYLALRALTLASESGDLDPLIDLALEAGNRPTLELVRQLADAAGSKLPKRGANDGDARAFVLAPLGGLRALREMDAPLQLRERILRRLPMLTTLELRALDGTVSLQTILSEGGRARFVPLGFVVPDGADPTGRVLLLTSEEHDALRALLGPSALIDAVPELRERAARRAHEAKPVEDARLDPGFHLGIVELTLGGAHGELGLLPPTSSRPAAHLRLLSGGRFVRRFDLSAVATCSFAAVIDDPDLPVTLETPAAAQRAATLAAHCIGAAEGALDALVGQLKTERPDARVRACLLERLSLHEAHPVELRRLGRLSQAPLVDTIHGRWVSLDQLLAEVQRQRNVACVAAAPRGAPPRELVLVMPAMFHRELLSRAGVPVEDITAQWQKHVDRQTALGGYPALPVPPPDSFGQAEASVAGVRVKLWVGPQTRGEVICVGLDARQIGSVPLDTVLPAVEGVATGEAVVDPTFSFVHLARAWPAIDVAVTALAARMIVQASMPGQPAGVEEWCRKLSLALAAAPEAHGKRMGALLTRLRSMPLFAAADGRLLSLDEVIASRPAAWERELVAAGLVPAPVVVSPAPVVVPPPPPSPEEVLGTRLHELLALLSLDGETRAQLARWPLLVVRRRGKTLVRFTRAHCEVDVENELGRAALTGDAAAIDLLAAVVVGAANHHLDEIDARHERDFLARLLAHASTRAGERST